LGVTDDSVLVAGGVLCGLLGPVLLSNIFSRFTLTSVLFLGERVTRKKTPAVGLKVPQS
jgi:hypothetical protein